MSKKLSQFKESESVKRTQTNIKNVERAQTGFHIDDETYRKHIERMKKQNAEYIRNNPNTIYKMPKDYTEEVEISEDMTQDQLETLRTFYTVVKKIDKESPAWKRAVRALTRLSKNQLHALSDLPFIGDEAKKLLHESVEHEHIMQSLANRDINSKIENGKVVVHKSNIAKARSHVKRLGHNIEVVSGLNEDVEQLDEISDELADKVANARRAASKNWRVSKIAKDNLPKTRKNFKAMLARDARKRRLNADSPEVAKIKADANAEYEYNKSRGWSNESYEMNEQHLDAVTPSVESIAKKHGKSVNVIEKQLKMGMKVEKEHTTDNATAREIALDHLNEKPNYYSKLNRYVESYDEINEAYSRGANIIREAWKKAKKSKKDEEVSTKPEKFESDPVLSDTIDKQ